jgi:tryptophan halogenase
MNNLIKKVVIVGGGTAGWMTAAYLSKALNHQIELSVVESPNINTIGVGEATFSTICLFFDFLGLKEEEWMPECHASYKMAIKFVNWNAESRSFYHPFQRFDTVNGRSIADWWLKVRQPAAPFDYSCFTVPAICDAYRSPRYMDGRVFDNKVSDYLRPDNSDKALILEDLKIQYPYAYHFDASLLARFLSGYAQKQGVRRIADDVIDVHLLENGHIGSIETKRNGTLAADLYVDCTGFRGLLINKVLGEPFISFSDSLLCDNAIAMQIPNDGRREGIRPYTTATALSSGWVWDIPLFQRIGTGYVYCSEFINPEQAEQEFRRHIGRKAEGCTASHIKMRIGRNRNSWVKNCVAIGLSSGFVEPLESTGIFFIQHGIEELVNYFPTRQFNEELIKSYNKVIADCIDGVREFLTLHYVASTRNDTDFWKACKRDIKIPEELAERLALWKHRLPTDKTIRPHYHGFESYSYSVMLLGLGFTPPGGLTVMDSMDPFCAQAAFDSILERSKHLARSLPSQYEYLASRYDRRSVSINSIGECN